MSMSERDRILVDRAFQAGYECAEELLGDVHLRALVEAWEAGFTACAHQHMAQSANPDHPITRANPFGRPERGA